MLRDRFHARMLALLLLLGGGLASGCGPSRSPEDGSQPGGGDPPARLVGVYSGTFFNSLTGTSAPAGVSVTTDEDLLRMSVLLGGELFGEAEERREDLIATISGALTTLGSVRSPLFGKVTGTRDADGALEITGTDVPGGIVTEFRAVGTWDRGEIQIEAEFRLFDGETAFATAELFLISGDPDPTADGTESGEIGRAVPPARRRE